MHLDASIKPVGDRTILHWYRHQQKTRSIKIAQGDCMRHVLALQFLAGPITVAATAQETPTSGSDCNIVVTVRRSGERRDRTLSSVNVATGGGAPCFVAMDFQTDFTIDSRKGALPASSPLAAQSA
jgi:hypothetical protein